MRVTVGTIVGSWPRDSVKKILELYPYLEPEDIDQALAYTVRGRYGTKEVEDHGG